MKTHHSSSRTFLAAVLAGALVAIVSTGSLHAQTPKSAAPAVDPATHAAHVAAGTMPAMPAPDAAQGDPALSQQLSQLQVKFAQLEAALAKKAPPMAGAPMPGMPAAPAMSMGMDKMKPNAAMPSMSAGAAPAPAMGMMGMMDKMMGMMDKMMSMGGDAPMPGGSAMPSGGGMGMDMMKMEMAGMMGMSAMPAAAPGAMPQSSLPGFPGASHLYHLGATGFFLDHPQHIALTTVQQTALNTAKEQAALAKSTADRAIEQAEQELWTLTAADQPDAAKIEAKIRQIEKLRGDERLAFIRVVGDASKLLTDEQRKSLTGFAPPTPVSAAMPMPPPAPAAPAMAPMTDM